MSNKPLIVAIALAGALAACHGPRGGGGGQTSPVTYGNTNPVTRQQENAGGAVPLRPGAQSQVTSGQGIVRTHTHVVSRGGKALVKVNVNKATAKQLQQVPGLSDNQATQIVQNRPYKNLNDMANKTSIPQWELKAYAQYLTF